MIEVKNIKFDNNLPLVLIAGPCVIENEKIVMQTAEEINEICKQLNIEYVFKSSFKKANRTSVNSFTGIGDEEGLKILKKVKSEFGLPVVTDIHQKEDAEKAAEVADILQIPAFLCRQTDLLVAAGKTGKIVNVKKGQFLHPSDMKHAAEKIESTGNKNIFFTERGTTFGYNNLVVDMRSLEIMKKIGYPVIMDATHAVQMPGGGSTTSGSPEFIKPLAKAATALGIAGLFLEVHPDPKNAKSDAASQLSLTELKPLLEEVIKIDKAVK